ncbi:MAG: hypothetical protein MK096_02505 [Oleiphilaceae bacterium]|nr:hypothetical protein [Oleiphilaceae bacterium]
MIRKLAIVLTLASAGYAGLTHALGLGDAKVNSNLNQPLVAEIELVNTGGLTDAEILPGLATREEFLKAGIDRVYFLSDIRFEVQRNESGEPKVVLTTKKPVREPFINFLVEVIWPSGRLLREYALLIDPPVFAEDKPVVASPAASQQAKPQVSAPASVEKGDNLAVRSSVKPKAGALAGNETYGPTKSTDTLWDIATGIRPDRNVSPQQVMLAIQDLNPDAFIDGNINKMKAGQILRLPTRDQMTSRSAYQAINSVIEQNAALRKPKTKTPTSSSKPSIQPAPKTQKPAANQDQLKLVVPDKDSKASDSAGSDPQGSNATGVSQGEMNIALEQLDKANLENEELSGKVDALEEQLETLQRILTLKNDQLASLQSQMRASELDAAQAEVDGGQGASQASVEETAEVAEVIVEQVKETVVLNEDGSVIAEQVEVAEVVAGIQVEEVKPAEAAPAEAPAPVNFQEDLLNKLMTNPLYQAGVAGILILLLIALWLISKSRAKRESDDYEEEYETVESDESAELESADEELEEPAGVVEEEADEEFVEEDAPASPEEDVIAESDVYIAYGRLDQAAQILEDGISNDPVRVDYRLKLLEVYRDLGDSDSFEKQFSELSAIQDQDALEKAAQIRVELNERLEELANQKADAGSAEEVEHLLDEDEEQALLSGDDNNFDFDTVEQEESEVAETIQEEVLDSESPASLEDSEDSYAEEALEEVAGDIDFSSEDLDIDLDIDLELDESDKELEVDPGIDFSSEDLDLGGDSDKAEELELDADNDASVADAASSHLVDEDDELSLSDAELNHEAEIDLDLSDELSLDDEALGLDEDAGAASEAESLESAVEEVDADDLSLELDEALDLDFDSESEEELSLDAEELDSLELDDSESEDLGDALDELDDLELEDSLTENAEADEGASDVLDLGDDELTITDETLDEAAEALGDADDFEPELSDDEDFDFLEGTDEVSTKLDLARAYIDMGDTEGAKEILVEVQQEGSDQQKQQANELIDSISK